MDLIKDLNKEQYDATTFNGKHLLVLAGAGTGKTHTIISRAVHLINNGVAPRRILILSFTRKSANEIVERIKATSHNKFGISDLVGRTFHSWCMDMIKNNPSVFEHYNHTVMDREDQESAFKLLCGKKFRDKDNQKISPKQLIDVYSYAINAKCNLTESIRLKVYDSQNNDEVYKKIELNKKLYADIIRRYLQYKIERNYIDYDDILNIVALGLKKNKEAQEYISSKYDHILVDEMQDTNPLQYELLSSFFQNCSLFCVGDDAQSIYGFRGADFKTIHNFVNIVADSQVKKLTLNYRSTQEILDLSNWLLSQSSLKYEKELTAYRGKGNIPQIINVENDWEEARDITNKILNSLKEKGLNYKDNMVLSRSLWGLKKVEGFCLEKKIPYCIYGGTSLMQSKHIRDVVSALRIIANIQDELAWMRYLMLWKGIGEVSAAKIVDNVIFSKNISEVISKLRALDLQAEIILTLEKLIHLQDNPSSAIKEALQTMESRLLELFKDEWEWRKQDFDILQEVSLSTGSITEFIAEYVLDPKLETTLKTGGKEQDLVILTTIHSAKGLEASICYIVNVSPYAYPTPRAILNGFDSTEEERRCLYVALTRAKDELYIYRNVYSAHIAQAAPKYIGEIKIGDIYVSMDTKKNKLKITDIREIDGDRYVEFNNIDYFGPNGNQIEWSFRRTHIPLSQIDNKDIIEQDDYYFLNKLPNSLSSNSLLDTLDKNIINRYNGKQIKESDTKDFDFS